MFAAFSSHLTSRRTLQILRLLLAAESCLLVLLVFISAHRRLHYPYALEWIEEGNLQEMLRVLHHQPLYVAPTLQYTPYIYGPLFFWLAAATAHVAGPGYPALRLVSILSTAGLFAALFGFVLLESPRRSPGRVLAAFAGVGLFATAYTITNGFFDVGRVDMLCLALAMAALLLVQREQVVAAAFCFALAVLAKQGILPIAVLALCSDWQRPRRLLVGLGSFAVFCAVPLLWLNHVSAGWSNVFLFRVAAGFALDRRILAFYLPHEILPAAMLSLALIVAGILLTPPRALNRSSSFYLLTGLGMVLYTGFVRAHAGAAGNADIPALLWIAFTAAVCFGRLYRRFVPAGQPALLLVLAMPLLQMLAFTNGPQFLVPQPKAAQLRMHLIEQVRGLPGDVLMIDHPQYSLAAGKPMLADGKALDGLITSPRLPFGSELQGELAALVHQRRFSALVVDGPLEGARKDDRLPRDFERFYPVRGEIPTLDSHDALTEPSWFFLPCPSNQTPDPQALLPGVALDLSACPR